MAAAYARAHGHPFFADPLSGLAGNIDALFSNLDDEMGAVFSGVAAGTAAAQQARARPGRCGAHTWSRRAYRSTCHAENPTNVSRPIRLDILEHDDAFEALADMPGVNKDAIHVKTEDDTVTISVGPPEVEAAEATADNSGAPPVPVGNGDVAPAPEGNGGGAPAPEGNGGGAAATEGNGGGPPAMDGNGGGPTAASSPRVLRSECLPRSYAPRTFTLSRQADLPQLTAKYVDGVLHVMAPKRPDAQPRTIVVQ